VGWLAPVTGWWPRWLETYAGAWQQNVTVDKATATAYWAVFACVTLIAKDISKLRPLVMQRDREKKIFLATDNRPVLRRPNHFQTYIEFFFYWVVSLLLTGNTYVLKRRDDRGFIAALYVLDPTRVTPLVAPDGSIYYQLNTDNIANLQQAVNVPASEIIHDRMYTLYHPLVGLSPLFACGVAAMQGSAIQNNATKFFDNMSRPSGILVAPGPISQETATALKTSWDTNYSGANFGKVAVIGDGLKYQALTVNAADAQMIEQLKMTAEMICACFHVPGYKIGVGPMPTVNNTAALNQQYFDQCLQFIIEKIELRLDEGLEVPEPFEVWFDLKGLLRMDPEARYKSHNEAIKGGWMAPDEARAEEDMPPVAGGATPYMQQQNYSLAALALRDTRDAQASTDVQAAAMNGAQVTSLQGIIVAASLGQIPTETARAAIGAAFPLLTPTQIDDMIAPLASFTPAPSDGTSLAPTVTPAPIDEDDEPDDEEGDAPPAVELGFLLGFRDAVNREFSVRASA